MIRVRTLAEIVEASAARFPEATFRSIGQERTWSVSELLRSSHCVAARLRERGVEAGELVGVLLPNSFELLAVYFGVLRAGAVLAPLAVPARFKNIEASLTRFGHILRQGGIRHVVVDPELASLAASAAPDLQVSTPPMWMTGDPNPPPIDVGE